MSSVAVAVDAVAAALAVGAVADAAHAAEGAAVAAAAVAAVQESQSTPVVRRSVNCKGLPASEHYVKTTIRRQIVVLAECRTASYLWCHTFVLSTQ
ncbi:hypothetical protein HW555_002546 [Spodoptera exigua]|uniref:Secreted protein n=1 Tax=Spodoptera exigua TaxID=7107 RepID=A0A835GM36_SPOEX|nr:hypothetical protein HW555_002546 [Spodoptera exigua]